MALWLNRSGRHCEHERKFLGEGRTYLTAHGLDADLSKLGSIEDLIPIVTDLYPDKSRQAIGGHASQMWTYAHRMQPGDWVAMPSKRQTIHIGEITGDYTHAPEGPDPYFHYRTVNWLEEDIPRTNFDQDILNSLGSIMTICRVKRNDAEARMRAMAANGWTAVAPKARRTAMATTASQTSAATAPAASPTDDDIESGDTDLDLEVIARDQIARYLYAKYSGHAMEDLVEAILQAQGFTTHHSDKGADGGIDILAAPDTLGFGHPRICVQVKSQATPLERPVLDQLVGTMQHVGADQGLLVCWGGFKPTIKRELPRLFFKVRLWDRTDLIDQFLAVYDRLDEDLQAEIPLKRVWAVAAADEERSA